MSAVFPPLSPRTWFAALRPWSFTATLIPVSLGGALATLEGHFNLGLFVLTLAGGFGLHAGTNLLNTYGDFVSGVDTAESAATCPQLVSGQMPPRRMYRAGWTAFALAGITGLVLAFLVGPLVLAFGLMGLIGGYWYTNAVPGARAYKYLGIGPYFVFFLMGPLMVVPSYYIQVGTLAWRPFWASLSVACLVAAIMHSNDLRDIAHDRAASIRTVAMRLGYVRALRAYAGLTLGAFVFLVFGLFTGVLPLWSALALVTLPSLCLQLRRIMSDEYNIAELEGWTAKFHLQFGLCLVFGVILATYLR